MYKNVNAFVKVYQVGAVLGVLGIGGSTLIKGWSPEHPQEKKLCRNTCKNFSFCLV
jgi:hypothetical protein